MNIKIKTKPAKPEIKSYATLVANKLNSILGNTWFRADTDDTLKEEIFFGNCYNSEYSRVLGLLALLDNSVTLWFYKDPKITSENWEKVWESFSKINKLKDVKVTIEI